MSNEELYRQLTDDGALFHYYKNFPETDDCLEISNSEGSVTVTEKDAYELVKFLTEAYETS